MLTKVCLFPKNMKKICWGVGWSLYNKSPFVLVSNYMTCQHYKFHNNNERFSPPVVLWCIGFPLSPIPSQARGKGRRSASSCATSSLAKRKPQTLAASPWVESWRHHPNVHPKTEEPPKTMGKMAFLEPEFKILCASQQVGKKCVIFWGETKIQRIFQKTTCRKG